MCWFVLAHSVACLLDPVVGTRRGDRETGLQILVLRQHLRLLRRRRPHPPRRTHGEKPTPAVLTAALARSTSGPRRQLGRYLLLCQPDIVLQWHRAVPRRAAACPKSTL